jgi:uncharacterized protein with von Willebrand factor type A (vWA) domain
MATPAPEPPATPVDLAEAFRQTRHDINNVLAVLFALAELSQRNPETAGRLTTAMLERGPMVLQKLNEFQELLAKQAGAPPALQPKKSK